MNAMQVTLLGCFLGAACCSAALAKTMKLNTDSQQTRKWTVNEITKGKVVSAPAVYAGVGYWGGVDSITIPFTNCDGYWRATRRFHIPVGATNLVLHITALGVDDRAVVKLNGAKITSVGTQSDGTGDMQFHDPGENVPYNFRFIAGAVSFTDNTHLKPGINELHVIVNNTDEGINGALQPVTKDDPSNFGLVATVTYTP